MKLADTPSEAMLNRGFDKLDSNADTQVFIKSTQTPMTQGWGRAQTFVCEDGSLSHEPCTDD